MSTAPDGCFPRHDGSDSDPRQTLSLVWRPARSERIESVQLHAGRKKRRKECARLHTAASGSATQLCAPRP